VLLEVPTFFSSLLLSSSNASNFRQTVFGTGAAVSLSPNDD
jgi:hypothetical protein